MELQPNPVIQRYLRLGKKQPIFFCPGCEIGIVMGALIRAINSSNLQKDEVFLVSGDGCSGRMPVYLDFCSMQTTHGRALTFATGVKLAKPHLKVIAIMGDGDALAIGGNHLLHASRRNIDLTALIINNNTMALTGGQPSPTTPYGKVSSFAPHGNLEHPIDICDFAISCGATFVGRQTAFQAQELSILINQAINHKGFSVVEALSYCHMKPEKQSPVEALKKLKDSAAPKGKTITGVIHKIDRPEFIEAYEKNTKKS